MSDENQSNRPYNREQEPENGRHPAYGAIRISRVSGNVTLLGSTLQTGQYVRLEICQSEEVSSGHGVKNIQPCSGSIVSVDMSEAQYAAMLTSMNMYSGTPCTIARREGKPVPTIPFRSGSERAHDMAKLMRERLDATNSNLDGVMADLVAAIDGGKGKTVLRQILSDLQGVSRDLKDNIPYLGTVFEENMDAVVETAKTEVNAYASSVHEGLRIQANAIGAPLPNVGLLSDGSKGKGDQ